MAISMKEIAAIQQHAISSTNLSCQYKASLPTYCATAQQIPPSLTTRRQFFFSTTLAITVQTPFVQYFFTLLDMYRWKEIFGHYAPLPALPIVQIQHTKAELFPP